MNKPKRLNLTQWISGDFLALKSGKQISYNVFGYSTEEKEEVEVFLKTENLPYQFDKTGITVNPKV